MKKWKFGVKITYRNFGYYSLVAWMLRISPVFLEFTDQMENRGKDGIWELSVSLAGWVRKIYPVYLEFIEKRGWKIGLKIGFDNLGSIPFGGSIRRFYPVFLEFSKKKIENRGKDSIRELRVAWMLRIYPFYLKFTDQMENRLYGIYWKISMGNRVKDWIWQLRIYSTRRTNSQNLPFFSRIH